MRIAYINSLHLNYGGGEARLRQITKGLAERGHDISVIIRKYRGRLYHKDPWYDLLEVGPTQTKMKPIMDIPFMLASASKTDGYDIVDMANPYSNITHRLARIRNRNSKFVCTIHHISNFKSYLLKYDLLFPLRMFLERSNMLLQYDRVVTVSQSSREEIVKCGINPNLISVIPNGVDQELFDSIGVEGKYAKPTIVSVSRIARRKGLEVLIHALKHLKRSIPDVQLVLIGKGGDRPRLENIVSNLGLNNSVKFTGYVSDEEKIKILKQSHVFGFPSELEGFGISPLEGMACGLPVVLNTLPVFKEVFGDSALYANSPEEFARKISVLLTDNSLYESYTERSREKAREYTWKRCVSAIESLYGSLLQK